MTEGVDVTGVDLDRLLHSRLRLLDAKAEVVAERMRAGALRQRLSAHIMVLAATLVAIATVWVATRRAALGIDYKRAYKWWDQSTSYSWGYQHGPAYRISTPVTIRDAVLEVTYPRFKWMSDLLGQGVTVSPEAARFLVRIVETKGTSLTAFNWHGGGSTALGDEKHFLAYPSEAFSRRCQSVAGRTVLQDDGTPWYDMMQAWSAKRAVGGAALADARDEAGSYRLWDGVEYVNPWAALFDFADEGEMRSNRAVEEYLCSATRHMTMLHVLFRRGLVGAAEELRTGYTTAATLWEALLGRGVTAYRPSDCSATRVRDAVDSFSLVGGLLTPLAMAFSGPSRLFAAGLSMLTAGGVGGAMYAIKGCGPRAVHK